MSKENIYNSITISEKTSAIAQACINFSVQRYDKNPNNIFVEGKFNGCASFIKFVLQGAGISIPDFIGPDGVQREMNHVNEFYDHFGISIPFGKHREGDLLIFSWNGKIPQHIGIVIDNSHYVHAHTKDGYVKKNKIDICEIGTQNKDLIYLKNPIGIKRATVVNDNPRWYQKPIV